jgi:hypothetical protein
MLVSRAACVIMIGVIPIVINQLLLTYKQETYAANRGKSCSDRLGRSLAARSLGHL